MKARRINFDTFGDRAKASSRLRAWMLADQLKLAGHQATLNGSLDVDIQVFQKRRDAKRLRVAKGNGARIVFDFDDNYLLDDVGAKDDIVSFMNLADVVTVGSHDLLVRAARYHEHVVLFENPLDVLPGSGAKQTYQWQGKIGWFGAPENQGTLHALGLRDQVTTVTADGDIPWNLETVDTVLQQFDLVLLPVEADAWTLAKNANRLLKCAALGVPFLASKTPEHELAVRQLRLPDWLLVEADGDWNARIEELGRRYRELPQLIGRARVHAVEHFGVAPVTKRWLQEITKDRTAADLNLSETERAALAGIDVVILGEDAPARVMETIKSLRGSEAGFRSISVISALPLDGNEAPGDEGVSLSFDRYADLFDIYDDLGHVLGSRSGTMTLVLQAGVHLKRGFFSDAEAFDPAAIVLFRGQVQRNEMVLTDLPPTLLDQLLTRPFRPVAVLLPNEIYQVSAGIQPRFGPLAIWELLIALIGESGVASHAVSTPLIGVAPDVASRTPMQSYVDLLTLRDPVAAENLPSLNNEWERLLFSLHAAVIEAHEGLFRHYQSTIMPRLSSDVLQAKGQRTEQQRERERTGRWLAQLRAQRGADAPRLARSSSGTIYLLDGNLKRHVPTWLMVRTLEDLFGAVEQADDGLDLYEDGPPVGMLTDVDGHVCFIVGGARYTVRGLPAPLAASADQLDKFPAATSTVDIYRSVERTLRKPPKSAAGPVAAPSPAGAPGVAEEPQAARADRVADEPPDAQDDARLPELAEIPAVDAMRSALASEAGSHGPEGAGAADVSPNGAEIRLPAGTVSPLALTPHGDTWVDLATIGAQRQYRPTFGDHPVLNDTHRALLEAPLKAGSVAIDIGLPGALRREDAAKLYELAYFGAGDVLILGLGHGLAPAIVAEAVCDGGRSCAIVGVDAQPRVIARVRDNLTAYSARPHLELVPESPAAFCRSQAKLGRTFGLVFVDHSTSRADIQAVSRLFPALIAEGGFALFHDFNDRRNKDTTSGGYGVYSGVADGLPMPPFAFFGVFGCAGLFRHAAASRQPDERGAAQQVGV